MALLSLLELIAAGALLFFARRAVLDFLYPLRHADTDYNRLLTRLEQIDREQDVSEIPYLRRILARPPEFNEQERLQSVAAPILARMENLYAAASPETRAEYSRRTRRKTPLAWCRALPKKERIVLAVMFVIAVGTAAYRTAAAVFFPSVGEDSLDRTTAIPLLHATITDDETGHKQECKLVFSSLSSATLVTANALGKTDGAPGQKAQAMLSVGHYVMDTEVTTADPVPLRGIDGIIGTGVLESAVSHGERYISIDRAKGVWQVGDGPYVPSEGAIEFPLDLLATTTGASGYTLELKVNGKTVRCLFDASCRAALVMPNVGRSDSYRVDIGQYRGSVQPTSSARLPFPGAPDYPRVGLGVFGDAKVTFEPGRRKLFVEFHEN